MSAVLSRFSAVASALVLATCGGDSGGGGPNPSFEIGVSPTTLTLQAGGLGSAEASVRAAGDITVSVARGLDFTGPITVTVEGLPAGVTATALTIASGQTSGTVTITAAGTAVAGNSTLVVRGSGSGVASKTANVALTVTAAPGFTLALSPTTISVAQGASGTTQVTLTRAGGFIGSVDFSATGMPAGMTVSFSPTSTTANASTATISVAAGVNAGSYPISLRGTFALLPVQSATLTVNVTAASAGDFAIAVAPNQLTIQQGLNANANVNITRSGSFTGTVNFTATSQPAGLNVTFNPAAATGNNSTVQVAVPAAQATGAYVVTIRGNGAPIGDRTVTLNVNVTATPSGTTVNYVFCARSGIPSWFAYQTGSGAGAGAWSSVPVQAGNTFSFVIPNGVNVGSVAYVIEKDAKSSLTIVNAGTSELLAQGTALCPPAPGTKTVKGSVTGMGTNEVATVSMGSSGTQVFSAVPGGAFQLVNVEDGAKDVLVAVLNTLTSSINRVGLRRNQNPADNATLTPFDVQAEGVAPTTYALTVNNRDLDNLTVTALYQTANGTSGLLFAGPQAQNSVTNLPGIPVGQQVASDLHLSIATAVPTAPTSPGFPNRSVIGFYHNATSRALDLPHAIADPVITVAATVPYVRPQASQSIVADVKDFTSISWTPTSGSVSTVTVSGTLAYYGAGPYLAVVPDFTGTTGWNNAWGLQPGILTNWLTFAGAWNGSSVIGVPVIQDGTVAKTASRAGSRTF